MLSPSESELTRLTPASAGVSLCLLQRQRWVLKLHRVRLPLPGVWIEERLRRSRASSRHENTGEGRSHGVREGAREYLDLAHAEQIGLVSVAIGPRNELARHERDIETVMDVTRF